MLQVVASQMGYDSCRQAEAGCSELAVSKLASSTQALLSDVHCDGTEANIGSCPASNTIVSCPANNTVCIICIPKLGKYINDQLI